jgi:hypothetical protein
VPILEVAEKLFLRRDPMNNGPVDSYDFTKPKFAGFDGWNSWKLPSKSVYVTWRRPSSRK